MMILNTTTKGKFLELKTSHDPRTTATIAPIGSICDWLNGNNVVTFEKYGEGDLEWSISSQINRACYVGIYDILLRKTETNFYFNEDLNRSKTFAINESNRQRIEIKKTCRVFIRAEIGFTVSSGKTCDAEFKIRRNGTPIPFALADIEIRALKSSDSSDTVSISIPVECNDNDYLEITGLATKTNVITFKSATTRFIIEEDF